MTVVVKLLEKFINSNDHHTNLKTAAAWLAEHGYVHQGGSNYELQA